MTTSEQFPSLAEASAQIRARRLTSTELTEGCLKRVRQDDQIFNSFITVAADTALEQAREADCEIQSGRVRGPLHGIPVALKDLIDAAGLKTTAASALLVDNIAQTDARVTRRLREAGAILLGKLNLHEFAYGGSGVISHYGAARNAADPRFIPGGSSSGSAVAVALGFCFGALGTDTAGSIRLPAACCGVVGFKPSYGTVSTEGVIELSRSYDHVGPLARSVEDARIVWDAIRETPKKEPEVAISGLRVGIMRKYFFDELHPDVREAIESAINRIRERWQVTEVVNFEVDPDRTVQMRESWNYHRQWVRESPGKYDPQTLQRIERGAEVTDDEFRTKLEHLHSVRAGVSAMFESAGIDLLITPTSPIPAPSFEQVLADAKTLRARELVMLRNTRPFNVWGTPAISVPCGATATGLPIGIQFAASPGKDDLLLSFVAAFEDM